MRTTSLLRSWLAARTALARPAAWLVLALVIPLVACVPQRARDTGEDIEDPSMPGPTTPPPMKPGQIVITPNPIDVVVGATEQQIKLTAFSTSYGDVTKKATWSLSDSSVGTISQGVLTIRAALDHGGRISIYANYGIQNGTGTLNLKAVAPDLVDASAPANARDYFVGSETGTPPTWVYPFERTLLPRNLGQVALQWSASGAQVYRLRVESPTYVRNIYIGASVCPGGRCAYQAPDADWATLARSASGSDAQFRVSASPGVGMPFGSADLKLGFSPEDVKGGLYYWSTTITGIYRVPIGSKTAQIFINRGNEFSCSGCHAVSRDGKKVALEFGSANGTGGGVVDGTDGTKYIIKPPSAGQWNLQTFSPKGDMLLVNWQQRGRVIDSTTGAKLFDFPEQMAQPEWSPDGQSIVYVRYSGGSGDEWNANNIGDITVIPFNGGAWGAPQVIVPASPNKEYHFYPSWTPDSKWIIFNTGIVPCKGGSGCNTYDPTNTTLRIVKAQPGSTPITLTRAVHQTNQGTNWPRVAPFMQNGKLIFFTFSARFPYGFTKTNNNPQIWMAGVDLDQAQTKPDEDPSFAPFWLPFQNTTESNHLGTWTTDVACETSDQCPGEFQCIGGNCVPKIG